MVGTVEVKLQFGEDIDASVTVEVAPPEDQEGGDEPEQQSEPDSDAAEPRS